MEKKYTLQEAMSKRLLQNGEMVDISRLYKPYKRIYLEKTNVSVSLENYIEFAKQNAKIYRNQNGKIFVNIYARSVWKSKDADFVASKLLTEDMYGIEAQYDIKDGNYIFAIIMGPDITVRFEGEEETPILELPVHTAYTC